VDAPALDRQLIRRPDRILSTASAVIPDWLAVEMGDQIAGLSPARAVGVSSIGETTLTRPFSIDTSIPDRRTRLGPAPSYR
jgi:hypothetical protein